MSRIAPPLLSAGRSIARRPGHPHETRKSRFLTLAGLLVQIDRFLKFEDPDSISSLRRQLREQIEWLRELGRGSGQECAALHEYDQYLRMVRQQPAPLYDAWRAERVDAHALRLPRMITDDTMRYLQWVTRRLTGAGHVVELGCWLGASTACLASGLRRNPLAAGTRVYAVDAFRWERWMKPYLKRVHFARRSLRQGDSYLDLFNQVCGQRYDTVIARVAYLGPASEYGLKDLVWNDGSIELLVYDMGSEGDQFEHAWRVLSPHFMPERTIVAVGEYGKLKAGSLRAVIQGLSSVLLPAHKPQGTLKAFRYVG